MKQIQREDIETWNAPAGSGFFADEIDRIVPVVAKIVKKRDQAIKERLLARVEERRFISPLGQRGISYNAALDDIKDIINEEL